MPLLRKRNRGSKYWSEKRLGDGLRVVRPALALGRFEAEGQGERLLGDAHEDQGFDDGHVDDATILAIRDIEHAIARCQHDLFHGLMRLKRHAATTGVLGVTREDLLHPRISRDRFGVEHLIQLDPELLGRDHEPGLEERLIGIGPLRQVVPPQREVLEAREITGPVPGLTELAGIRVRDDEKARWGIALGQVRTDVLLRHALCKQLTNLRTVDRGLVALEDHRLHTERDALRFGLDDHDQISLFFEQILRDLGRIGGIQDDGSHLEIVRQKLDR